MFENREIFTSIRKQEFYILCRLILHALHSTLFFHINRARIFVHPFLLLVHHLVILIHPTSIAANHLLIAVYAFRLVIHPSLKHNPRIPFLRCFFICSRQYGGSIR